MFESTTNSSWICSSRIREVNDQISRIYLGPNNTERQQLVETFGLKYPNMMPTAFLYFIADIFAGGVQTGKRTKMCDRVLTEEWQKDPIKSTALYAKENGESPNGYDVSVLNSTKTDPNSASRQWAWQYCNELGFF